MASGSALDEVAPPSAPRFDPHDGAALQALMLRLASQPQAEDAATLAAWAARYDLDAYRLRLGELLGELA